MPDNSYRPPPGPPVYRGAQTARFDNPTSSGAGGKADEDALPAMPSWGNAVTRRVEDEHAQDDVEMEPLKSQSRMSGQMTPVSASTPGYNTGYRGFEEQKPYAARSPAPTASPVPTRSPYDQSPYRDYFYGNHPSQPRSVTPGSASPYGSQAHTPQPYPQAQPYASQFHSQAQPQAYASPFPSQPQPQQQFQSPYNPMPTSPTSPGPDDLPRHPEANRPTSFTREPSLPSIQPPSYTSQPPYSRGSPAIPSSPPPPFSPGAGAGAGAGVSGPAYQPYQYQPPPPQQQTPPPGTAMGGGRPPSLLQSGRKPVPNSYRDV